MSQKREREEKEQRVAAFKRQKLTRELLSSGFFLDLPDHIRVLIIDALRSLTLQEFISNISSLSRAHYESISRSIILWRIMFEVFLVRRNRWLTLTNDSRGNEIRKLKNYQNIWNDFIKNKLHVRSVATFWKGAFEYSTRFNKNPILDSYSQLRPHAMMVMKWKNLLKPMEQYMDDNFHILDSPSVKILDTYGSVSLYSFPLKSPGRRNVSEIRGLAAYDIINKKWIGKMVFPMGQTIDYVKVSDNGKLYIVTIHSPLISTRTGEFWPNPNRTYKIYLFNQIMMINWSLFDIYFPSFLNIQDDDGVTEKYWEKFEKDSLPNYISSLKEAIKKEEQLRRQSPELVTLRTRASRFSNMKLVTKIHRITDQHPVNHLVDIPKVYQYDSNGFRVNFGFDKCSYAVNDNFIAIGYTKKLTLNDQDEYPTIGPGVFPEHETTTKILIFDTHFGIDDDPKLIDIRLTFNKLIDANILNMNLYEHWIEGLKTVISPDGDDDPGFPSTPPLSRFDKGKSGISKLKLDSVGFAKSNLTSFLSLNGENGLMMDNNNLYIIPYLGPLSILDYEDFAWARRIKHSKIYIIKTLACSFKLDSDLSLNWPPSDPDEFKEYIAATTAPSPPQQFLYYPRILKIFTGYMTDERVIAIYYDEGDYHLQKSVLQSGPSSITLKYNYRLSSRLNYMEIDTKTGYVIYGSDESLKLKFTPEYPFVLPRPNPSIPIHHPVTNINDIIFSRNLDKLIYMVKTSTSIDIHAISLLTGTNQLVEKNREHKLLDKSNHGPVYQINKSNQNNLHDVFWKLHISSGFFIIDKRYIHHPRAWKALGGNYTETIILTTFPGPALLASNISNTMNSMCFNPTCCNTPLSSSALVSKKQEYYMCTNCYDAVYCSKECQQTHYNNTHNDKNHLTSPNCFEKRKMK